MPPTPFQTPFFSASAPYRARQSGYVQPDMPMLYHRQPAPSDGSVSPDRSDHGRQDPSSVDYGHGYLSSAEPGGYLTDPYLYDADEADVIYGTHFVSTNDTLSQEFYGQRPQTLPTDHAYSHYTRHIIASDSPLRSSSNLPGMNDLTNQFGTLDTSPREHQQIFDSGTHSSSNSPNLDQSPPQDALNFPSDDVTESYLRRTLLILEPTPVNLWALPELTEGLRLPPVGHLIKLAIWGSPQHKLTLNQIYEAVEERYPPCAQASDKPWRRSIRHNLSLKSMFVNLPATEDHHGKGKYWALNVRMGEGSGRRRARGKHPQDDNDNVKQEDSEIFLTSSDTDNTDSRGYPGETLTAMHPPFHRIRHTSPVPYTDRPVFYPRDITTGRQSYHSIATSSQHIPNPNRSLTMPVPGVNTHIDPSRRGTTGSINYPPRYEAGPSHLYAPGDNIPRPEASSSSSSRSRRERRGGISEGSGKQKQRQMPDTD